MTLIIMASLASCAVHAEMSFSKTQSIDKIFTPLLEADSLFKIDWTTLELPRPPDSAAESAYLVELQKFRTPEIIRAIKAENDDALDPGQYLEPNIVTIGVREDTKRLCDIIRHETGVAVVRQEQIFDRVRPSFVNPELVTVIGPPGLPSYPSGHSCQFHLLAYFLASVNPEKAKDYLAKAEAIAKNREFAGVNYPSDTYAGKIMAKLMIRRLLEDKRFQGAFLAAAEEWPGPSPIDKMITLKAFSLPDPKPSKQ